MDGLIVPSDFVILVNEDFDASIILGRPFSTIGKVLIDVESGGLSLRFNSEKVIFNLFEWTQHIEDKDECYKIEETKMDGELIRGKSIDVRVSLVPGKP